METLAEAKQYLRANWEKGVNCPCCSQFVKKWRQPLHAGQAVWLINLVREYELTPEWMDVKILATKTGMRGGDYAKLRYWGLVESQEKTDESKRASGRWRPTSKGITFAHGNTVLPKAVYTYDRKVLGFSDDQVTIQEVLGDKFDYNALWGKLV